MRTALTILMISSPLLAATNGILIEPNETGLFEYADDFSTPRCLTEAFLSNTGPEVWSPGSLTNSGPNRNRTLTYRFHAGRAIAGAEVAVTQRANAPNLGATNTLYLSTNGLDWTRVAGSSDQEPDANGWQAAPLTVSQEPAGPFLGHTELWLRLVLDNYCGLKTGTSNIIDELAVTLTLGDPPPGAADPQAALRARWGALRERAGWSSVSLDAADPPPSRPPHYYEDSDGWLRPPGESPHLLTDESDAFRFRRAYDSQRRLPLGLGVFVRTGRSDEPLMARITVAGERDSTRDMQVLWDGQLVGALDIASYLPRERLCFVELPVSGAAVHELRITASDSGSVTVREVAVVGAGRPAWVSRPPLPRARVLQVLSADYLPDPPPPPASQAVEGRHAQQDRGLVLAGLQRLYEEHADFGALRVTLRNSGPVPVRIAEPLLLNGQPLEDSYVDFETSDWDASGVVWYRVRPQLLQPGECAEVYVRFRRKPEGDAASLTIPCANADALELTVPYQAPSVCIDYITPDRSGEDLLVYVRRTGENAAPVSQVSLDAAPSPNATLLGADLADGMALAVLPLKEPLDPHSYHVVTARTEGQETVGAQFRVLPWLFPRSSIHVPSELCDEMHMNLGMWYHRSLEECEEHDIVTSTDTHRVFDAHERVLYILGPDEPDANDNRGGGYSKGLGSHARRLADSGWTELVRTQSPHVATWLIMNGTTRPLNWCVYGQFADIACFDPYPINFYGADHAHVRESLDYARLCGAPSPMFACLEAFGWQSGQGVPTGARGPIPAEYRQNVIQALGAGAKGLTSWVYSAGAGGWQLNEALRDEIAQVNALIAGVEDTLLLGTPVPWASSDAGEVATGVVGEQKWPKERVAAQALLCGPETIAVAVTNHIPAGKPEPPTIEPARNVTVTVELPDYLQSVTAFEATETGLAPVPCTVDGGAAVLNVDSIESGRLFILRADRGES